MNANMSSSMRTAASSNCNSSFVQSSYSSLQNALGCDRTTHPLPNSVSPSTKPLSPHGFHPVTSTPSASYFPTDTPTGNPDTTPTSRGEGEWSDSDKETIPVRLVGPDPTRCVEHPNSVGMGKKRRQFTPYDNELLSKVAWSFYHKRWTNDEIPFPKDLTAFEFTKHLEDVLGRDILSLFTLSSICHIPSLEETRKVNLPVFVPFFKFPGNREITELTWEILFAIELFGIFADMGQKRLEATRILTPNGSVITLLTPKAILDRYISDRHELLTRRFLFEPQDKRCIINTTGSITVMSNGQEYINVSRPKKCCLESLFERLALSIQDRKIKGHFLPPLATTATRRKNNSQDSIAPPPSKKQKMQEDKGQQFAPGSTISDSSAPLSVDDIDVPVLLSLLDVKDPTVLSFCDTYATGTFASATPSPTLNPNFLSTMPIITLGSNQAMPSSTFDAHFPSTPLPNSIGRSHTMPPPTFGGYASPSSTSFGVGSQRVQPNANIVTDSNHALPASSGNSGFDSMLPASTSGNNHTRTSSTFENTPTLISPNNTLMIQGLVIHITPPGPGGSSVSDPAAASAAQERTKKARKPRKRA